MTTQHSTVSTQRFRWRMLDDNPNEWIWTPRAKRRHDLSTWREVDLPMSVQEALWRAKVIPDPYRDLNSRAAEWVEHRDWIFGLDFEMPPPPLGDRTFMDFESVADECMVYLNGTLVGQHEGPGAPFSMEIGPFLRAEGNQLFVVVRAPHPEEPQTGWTENTRSLRGRMGFGWDFAPRLVPTGILGGVAFRHTGSHRLSELWARPRLSTGLRSAVVALSVRVDGPPGAEVRFSISRGNRQVAVASAPAGATGVARAEVELSNPQIWWPNGMGSQPLYTVKAEVDGSDAVEAVFGVREVKWEIRPGGSEGEWPLMLVVNGRRVFQRGWNWVPADAMAGPRATPRMKRLLTLARAANVNILRCWGGADPETRAFYDRCDRLGILVWQEFPLSSAGISNAPPDDPQYLERMATYARDVVIYRRNHPSLALWDGGNELYEEHGKPLTMDNPYSQVLAGVIHDHDPDRTFRPSSPLGPTGDADPAKRDQWDVHGPWEYSKQPPGPQYVRINQIEPALHSELGAPGVASLHSRRRFLSPAHRSPVPGNPAWRHHGGAWWDHRDTVESLFGPIGDEGLYVLASQWLQGEALRYYIEETRRRWPRSGGIFPWQLNEPWPNMACTSAIEYAGRPKLAYFAVRGAYRPTIATARYNGLVIEPGEPLRAEVWALNEGPGVQAQLSIAVRDLAGRDFASPVDTQVSVGEARSSQLLDLEIPLPADLKGVIVLDLSLSGVSNRYIFSNDAAPALRSLLDFPLLLAEMFSVPRR